MARTRPASFSAISQRKFTDTHISQIIYAEGNHDYKYLNILVKNKTINPYKKGTDLPATNIKSRILKIEQDLRNDAIMKVIWIVDGCDNHIKQSEKIGKNEFFNFYLKWAKERQNEKIKEEESKNNPSEAFEPYWTKLEIYLINPCLEYWFLLHKTDPPKDANDNFICYKDANELLTSSQFNRHLSKGKGDQLVNEIAKDATGLRKAIERAKTLELQCSGHQVNKNNLFSTARAEIYQLFGN